VFFIWEKDAQLFTRKRKLSAPINPLTGVYGCECSPSLKIYFTTARSPRPSFCTDLLTSPGPAAAPLARAGTHKLTM
jgi:hypothetical protein